MQNTDPPEKNHPFPALTPEVRKFIESMGIYFENEGVPRIGGRILGLLLITDGPLSAEQLASTLKVSRASISTNIRMLTSTSLVEKVALLDTRHTQYVIADDVWDKAILSGQEKVAAFRGIAELGLESLPENIRPRRRLEEMIEWSNVMGKLFVLALNDWRQRAAEAAPAAGKVG
jgi:hypothetical protein